MVSDFLFRSISHWEGKKDNKNDDMPRMSLKLLSLALQCIFFFSFFGRVLS